MLNYTFPRKNSLSKKKEIKKVFKGNVFFKNRNFVIYYISNNYNFNRICLITTKKIGKAHKRNRLKRLIKEYFRLNQYNFINHNDFVIIIRKFNKIKNYNDAEISLNQLLKKYEIIK